KEMATAINDQISYEASSANAYIAIGSWCERIGYDGSAAFFFEQAAEENGHMLKFVIFLLFCLFVILFIISLKI
ncbi:MAG: ferritin-like domain-containing protein, partial [Candidatus Nitrosopolaris sp.]